MTARSESGPMLVGKRPIDVLPVRFFLRRGRRRRRPSPEYLRPMPRAEVMGIGRRHSGLGVCLVMARLGVLRYARGVAGGEEVGEGSVS